MGLGRSRQRGPGFRHLDPIVRSNSFVGDWHCSALVSAGIVGQSVLSARTGSSRSWGLAGWQFERPPSRGGSGAVDVHGDRPVGHRVGSVGGVPALWGLGVLLGLDLRGALGERDERPRLVSSTLASEVEWLSRAEYMVDGLAGLATVDSFLFKLVIRHGADSRPAEDVFNYTTGEPFHEEALGFFIA